MTMNAGKGAAAASAAGREVEQGILLMLFAMLTIPGIDAIAKYLSATVPPGQVAWSRFFFQILYMAPFVVLAGRVRPGPVLVFHALRGMLIAGATLLFFWGLAYLPLAEAISIFFVEPLLLTLLAAVFLAEPIGWRRLLAVLAGFVGALVIMRPGSGVFGFAALLPLGAACCFAFYLILTRRLAQSEDAAAMQLWAGIFGCLTLSLALLAGSLLGLGVIDPVWPSAAEWGLMAALGAIATAGHMCVVLAFRRAGPAILAPFQYVEIVSATLLGLIVFGDFPDPQTWIGVGIIVAAGLYVFHRERRLSRSAAA